MSIPETIDRVLELSEADDCIVIGHQVSEANIRWANTTSTTNGATTGSSLTVVSIRDGRVGSVTRSHFPPDRLPDLVRESEAACEGKPEAEDRMPLLDGDAAPPSDWSAPHDATDVGVFDRFAPALADTFDRARSDGIELFGYAEHSRRTVHLGTSSGIRRRDDRPEGLVEITAKSPDFARSSWAGRTSTTFTDVDPNALYERVRQRLEWSKERIDLDAGRYEVLLEPSAVADMLIYMYWSASAREADEGRSVFSAPGGGNRIGERLGVPGLTLYSDPDEPDLGTAPFQASAASSSYASVFDNGLPRSRTEWISDGTLRNLARTRHWAQRSEGEPVPFVDNLVLPADGRSVEEMIASTERALLVTCFWYIRVVDPRTLLLTGLTRDGVFLVEDGEVRGAVNNFRFNESPVDMLGRITELGRTQPTLAREFGDYFRLTKMPAARIDGFNMSSVSEAT